MKLEQSFTVAAPVEQVWAALIDVERVAPCLPGAEISGADDEGAYHGTFTVKLGPTTAAYNGTLRLDEVDESAHTVVMSARGTDKRGQGGATATIRSVVAPDPDGGTKVDVDTDFTITGRLARFGRGGMIEDVSRRLLGDFSSCLQQRIVAEAPAPAPETPSDAPAAAAPSAPPPPPPAAKPVNGLRLFFQVLGDRIRRLLRRER
jgi:carbon monoxide dehydrogenase subunit G